MTVFIGRIVRTAIASASSRIQQSTLHSSKRKNMGTIGLLSKTVHKLDILDGDSYQIPRNGAYVDIVRKHRAFRFSLILSMQKSSKHTRYFS